MAREREWAQKCVGVCVCCSVRVCLRECAVTLLELSLTNICIQHPTLQHTGNTLQHTATHCNTPGVNSVWPTSASTPTLRHTTPHCNTLQHTATHYTTLHHSAPHYNTPGVNSAWPTSASNTHTSLWRLRSRFNRYRPATYARRDSLICEIFCVTRRNSMRDIPRSYVRHDSYVRHGGLMHSSRPRHDAVLYVIWLLHMRNMILFSNTGGGARGTLLPHTHIYVCVPSWKLCISRMCTLVYVHVYTLLYVHVYTHLYVYVCTLLPHTYICHIYKCAATHVHDRYVHIC